MLLAQGELVGGYLGGAAHRSPGRQRVPAACELFVFRAVTRLAVQRGDIASEHKVVVFVRFLPVECLMTVVARDVGLAVRAALELVDDRGGLLTVALRASPRGLRERGRGSARVGRRSGVVDHEGRHHQAASDDTGNEDRLERYGSFSEGRNRTERPRRGGTFGTVDGAPGPASQSAGA